MKDLILSIKFIKIKGRDPNRSLLGKSNIFSLNNINFLFDL